MGHNLSLANHFLVAVPSIKPSIFDQAVIYVCEHHEQGTVGLMVNRPMSFSLNLLFNQLHIEPSGGEQSNCPILFGGPYQPERGFVIHRPLGSWGSSIELQDGVAITTSNDIIRAIAKGVGPKDVLVTLGYVGWNAEILEKEVIDNVWLVCPYKAELLYEVPFEKRWSYAGLTLGVNMQQLISDAGHA